MNGDVKYANVRARIGGDLIYNVIFQETLQGDMAFAAFGFLFMFVYIWSRIDSFFITLISMLMILMSFPVSYMIYTGIFQISMNTKLNYLTIFIVLGIATDNIFVYCDAWR